MEAVPTEEVIIHREEAVPAEAADTAPATPILRVPQDMPITVITDRFIFTAIMTRRRSPVRGDIC